MTFTCRLKGQLLVSILGDRQQSHECLLYVSSQMTYQSMKQYDVPVLALL
jgi:hypothetical protein